MTEFKKEKKSEEKKIKEDKKQNRLLNSSATAFEQIQLPFVSSFCHWMFWKSGLFLFIIIYFLSRSLFFCFFDKKTKANVIKKTN